MPKLKKISYCTLAYAEFCGFVTRASQIQLSTKILFTSNPGDSTPKLERFISAMKNYAGGRKFKGWTPGETLDVIAGLGHVNGECNFEICVHRYAIAVAKFRQHERQVLFWRDALDLASMEGWRLPI